MFRIVIIVLLLGVLTSLFSGLFFLYRDRGEGERAVKALTLRIALSIGLFVLLILGYRLGWIHG
jgi:uncharacterized SAM-binding protein YcdF (DUF218 family)